MAKKKSDKTKGLYKRGNTWCIRYSVNGEQIKETIGDEATARRMLRVRQGEIETDSVPQELFATQKHLMSDLCDKYLQYCIDQKQKGVSDKKWKMPHIKARFGSLPVNKVTSQMIEDWQKELIAGTKHKKPVQPVTTNRWVAVLKNMLTMGVKWKMAVPTVLYEVRTGVDMFPETESRERYLTEAECSRLLNACHKRILPMVVIGLHTGLRRGSVLGMTWDKVDFNSGIITVPVVNSKTSVVLHVRMSQGIRSILENLPRYGDYCFCWKNGKPYADFRGEWKKTLEKAEITDFRLHDLRHTFASLNVMNGEDLYKVSKYLGHSTILQTQKYAHLAPGYMKGAADNMDRLAPVPSMACA